MTVDRAAFLKSMLNKPWQANAKGPDAFDCFHGFVHVQQALFGQHIDPIDVPSNPSWRWLIDTISAHPERERWAEVPCDPMGLVRAQDGAAVLMSRSNHPAHIGTWMAVERRVLHVDPKVGVVLEALIDLRTKGWVRLKFLELKKGAAATKA